MTTIEIRHIPGEFAGLVQDLWDGQISEQDFIAQASQQGASLTRIIWEIEQLKLVDGVL